MAIVVKKQTQSPLKATNELYADFTSDFDLHPVKNDVVRVTNDEAVKQSIKNILATNRGERFFNSDFGSDVRALLFENMHSATGQVLEDIIRSAIENHEPRATVEDIKVSADPEEQYISVTLVFSIINKQEPIELDLILNRVR